MYFLFETAHDGNVCRFFYARTHTHVYVRTSRTQAIRKSNEVAYSVLIIYKQVR